MSVSRLSRIVVCLAIVALAGCQSLTPTQSIGSPVLLHPGQQRHVLAVPSNDTKAGATALTFDTEGLFYQRQDVSEATATEDTDSDCTFGAPLQNTVWFRYEATGEDNLEFNFGGSGYQASLVVYEEDAAGNPLNTHCSNTLFTTTGNVYYIRVNRNIFGFPGEPTGTDLVFRGEKNPTPLEFLGYTVDPVLTFTPNSSRATITGTMSISRSLDFGGFVVTLKQKSGLSYIEAGSFPFTRTPAEEQGPGPHTRRWSVDVESFNGIWAGGKAQVVGDQDGNVQVHDVVLKPAKRR